ncbi:MAG: hypothetical protein K6E14_06930, partial [Paludibacteraceae bacterium]|nr:hypothetical protein [Paludibacteraceae bacterium]
MGSYRHTLKDCHIGYNEGIGLDYSKPGYSGDLKVYGGEIVYNKKNGVVLDFNTNYLEVVDVVFDSNVQSAITLNTNHSYSFFLSDNKFLHTNNPYPAIKTTDPYPVPEFTSCKMTEKTIVIEGKIDTAAKAKIELFYTSQGEQTAEMLVDSFYTNADGTFSDTLDRSMFVGKSIIEFTATATYGKITSPLSDVVYPELGKVDLTRTEFYVKMNGYGDGSTWDKAMSPQTFAYYLPQAKDGSTFHVAEGEYNFSELFSEKKSVAINNKGVNIIGGYYKEPSNGDMPNAIDYKTRFVANQEDKFILKINGETSSSLEELINDVNIQGVEFVDIQLSGSYLKNMKVDSCLFYSSSNSSNKLTNTAMLCYYVNKVGIGSCFFDMNHTGSSLYINTSNNIIIKSSTFTEDFYSYQSIKAEHVSGDVLIGNCTFVNIPCYDFITIYTEGKTYFYNNTVVGNAYAPNGTANIRNGSLDLRNCIMVGNIYAGNYMNSVLNQLLDSHDNLYSSNFNQFTDKDKTINDSDLHEILDGENKEGIFIPNLAYNGGFTPTVALKSDKLSDGKSIRFPRLDDVLTDQRGVSRLPETCMGAYEIGCGNDTTIATVADTINVGTKIYGQTFTEVGVHDGIFETLQNVNGCDSVVMHKVVVRPTAMNYYVKTKRVNKGDGSNWDNAMNDNDFITYLPLAPEGATFHVAAGEYLKKSDKLKSISVKNDVTIIGGYPADATKGAVSDPKKYSTHISLFRELTSGSDAVKV